MVFFTYGISFKTWVETGLVGRELLIYKKLAADGFRVSLITYGDETDLDYQHLAAPLSIIPVYRNVKRPTNKYNRLLHSLILPFKIQDILKSADLYKTNQMFGSWVPVICKFLYNKPLVVRCGYEWLRNEIRNERQGIKNKLKCILGYILEIISYVCADKIIISNHSDIEFIQGIFPIKSDKVDMIRNFIDTSSFCPENIYPNSKVYHNRVIYVGRISKRKNLGNSVKAIAGTEFGLDIAGQGEERESLQKLAEKERANVRFIGAFPNNELPKIINQYPVCILPSLYENNPKTLMEAMACGRAVIGTDVEGIKELIQHNNGLLCKTDADSIKLAINRLMKDRSLREELGKNARTAIVKSCSLNKIFQKEYTLYQKVLSDRIR